MKGNGYVDTFVGNVQNQIVAWLLASGFSFIGLNWLVYNYITSDIVTLSIIMLGFVIIIALALGIHLAKVITKPTQYLARAIMHIAPSEQLTPAPNMEELRLGRELASTLARQIYDLNATNIAELNPNETMLPATLFDQLPVATIGIDEAGVIVTANSKALATLKVEHPTGESLENLLKFSGDSSVIDWLHHARKHTVTEVKTWQKIEISSLNDGTLGYFDVAISFNKHSASGIETMITLYDHSDAYSDETMAISFIAMAVHELRTPVTILRGYIEAFDEDIGTDVKPEVADYIKKMSASAQGLSSFISNILNVARINQGQLTLDLVEDSWNKILPEAIDNLRNRATVHGKNIELRMQPDMPNVAVDRLTASEVVTNLIDNAIKYSPDNATQIIIVSKVNSEGLIETTVQDQGVGVPQSVMDNLFNKFSRNHRNQSQISGTGLGLYLSKAIITAHHGNIWASSKEGEGSTFGFTLIPFSQLAKDQQSDNNGNIVHTSHGWIKNHSMQRR